MYSFISVGSALAGLQPDLPFFCLPRLQLDSAFWGAAARLRPDKSPSDSQNVNDAHFMQNCLLQVLHTAANASSEIS